MAADPASGADANRAGAFEIIDHTADWAVRVWGSNFGELLLNAARAMNSLLVDQQSAPEQRIERRFTLEAFDRESMLVEWLSELAYLAESERLVFTELALERLTATELVATVRGDQVDQLQKHIKAVTYHNLAVVDTADGLEATVVFDV